MALRKLGRIEYTLFTLDWVQSVKLRRRMHACMHAGLSKGKTRKAVAKAVSVIPAYGESRTFSVIG